MRISKLFLIVQIFVFFFYLSNKVSGSTYELHEGDFVVEKNDTLVIKDKTLEVDGDVILEEGSSLRLENATLIIKQRYKSEHSIKSENAKLAIINSEIRPSENVMVETYGMLTGTELNVHIREQSSVTVQNSKVYGRIGLENSTGKINDSIVSYVYWTLNSDAEIADTLLGSFVFDCKQGVPEEITLDGLKTNQPINFSLERTSDGGHLRLQNVNVKVMWSYNLEWECKKQLTVKNSDFDLFWIKFPPTDNRIKIENLPTGFIKEFDLKKSVSGIELPYNVKLLNMELERFKPEMLGTKAEITNSNAMVHAYDVSDLIIRKSKLQSFFNYGSKKVEFYDVALNGNIQLIHKPEFASGLRVGNKTIGPGGYFNFIFSNSVIDAPEIVVANIEGTMDGEVKIISPKSLDNVHWVKGIVTRKYPVNTAPNTALELLENGLVKWKGVSDENGKAYFDIVFDKDTYTKEYELNAAGTAVKIDFLTDTPVNLKKSSLQIQEPVVKGAPDSGGRKIIILAVCLTAVAAAAVIMKKIYKKKR